jgi:hypothetical protein
VACPVRLITPVAAILDFLIADELRRNGAAPVVALEVAYPIAPLVAAILAIRLAIAQYGQWQADPVSADEYGWDGAIEFVAPVLALCDTVAARARSYVRTVLTPERVRVARVLGLVAAIATILHALIADDLRRDNAAAIVAFEVVRTIAPLVTAILAIRIAIAHHPRWKAGMIGTDEAWRRGAVDFVRSVLAVLFGVTHLFRRNPQTIPAFETRGPAA